MKTKNESEFAMKSVRELGDSIHITETATEAEKEFYAKYGYKGCGKAWAAVKGGQIVAMIYMGQGEKYFASFPPFSCKLPLRQALGIDCEEKYFNYKSPRGKSEICKAAVKLGFISDKKTNGLTVSGSTLCNRLRKIMRAEAKQIEICNKDYFENWRNFARAELAKFGEVISGMCSCHQFIPKKLETIFEV